MKTKHIPVLIALVAGLITCLISFFNHVSIEKFVGTLCLVVVIFLIIGLIVKVVFDKNFPMETEAETETEEKEQENGQEETADGEDKNLEEEE